MLHKHKYFSFVAKKMINILTRSSLFKDMTENEKKECIGSFHFQLKKYKKNQVVVYAQDKVIQQLILLSGAVKNEMSDFNGKSIKITDIEAPRLLAPGFLFGNMNHYPVSIFANTDCEIMAINRDDFLNTLLKNDQLQLNFLNLISNQTQFLTRKINFLNLKTIKAKVAHYLLNLYKRQHKQTVLLPQSQTQLAELFGVTRPSLSRTINELSHEGVVRIEAKRITILDMEALKQCLS